MRFLTKTAVCGDILLKTDEIKEENQEKPMAPTGQQRFVDIRDAENCIPWSAVSMETCI